MTRRGILLAGGRGSRLGLLTQSVSKQLLPVFDKPLILYPLSTLMLAGVREILVISTPKDLAPVSELLRRLDLGVHFEFAVQTEPRGIADALIVGREFLQEEPSVLALGDNVFHGATLGQSLSTLGTDDYAHVFALPVANPEDYAVVTVDSLGLPKSLDEKPSGAPRGSLAVPGLYFFPADACSLASQLQPSPRGEMEVTDLNREYLLQGRLRVHELPRGTAWFDAGTPSQLLGASSYVELIQRRQGLLVGMPHEVAWRRGWISDKDFHRGLGMLSDDQWDPQLWAQKHS